METILMEASCYLKKLFLITVADTDQNRSGQGQRRLSRFLRLVEGFSEIGRQSQYLTGRTHLRSQNRVYLLEHIEGEYRLLHAVMMEFALLKTGYRGRNTGQLLCNNLGSQLYHLNVADLGYQRHRSGRSRIGLQYKYLTVLDGILHIHQTADMHLFRNLLCIFLNRLYILL